MPKRASREKPFKTEKMMGIYQVEGRVLTLIDTTDARTIHLLPNMRATPVAVVPWADYRRLLKAAKGAKP